ncbi:MAG TPA: hypothetical protein VJT54_11625 [Verrucomicrobiae bacterium]|nr:hypothetical protein [Verrucomicrobiae bacterium]
MTLPRLRLVVLPEFNFGKEFLFPVVGNDDQRRVPSHLLGEFLLPDQAAVVQVWQLVLVRAAIVAIPATAPLGVALAGDAVAARATGGEIEKEKSLVAPLFAGLADGDERGLDFVEGLFGNHGGVYALVHFALVEKDAVIERIAKHVADGRERQWFSAPLADKAHCGHFISDGRQGTFTSGEKLQDFLHLLEILRVRLDGAELRFVTISQRGFAEIDAAPHLFTDATLNVHRKVADVLIRHTKLDGNHEHVVGRQICLLERANLLNDAALQEADDLSAVVEIAGEPIQFP